MSIVRKIHDMQMTEVDMAISWKIRWKRIGNWCNGLAKTGTCLSLVFTFVSGFYNLKEFIFAAGCTNSVSLALLSYGNYCFSQAKSKNQELHQLLKSGEEGALEAESKPSGEPEAADA